MRGTAYLVGRNPRRDGNNKPEAQEEKKSGPKTDLRVSGAKTVVKSVGKIQHR